MAVRAGKSKTFGVRKGCLIPTNKFFVTVGKAVIIKGKVKRDRP